MNPQYLVVVLAAFLGSCGYVAAQAGGASPTAMAMTRMNGACTVQPNATLTEKFAGCLGDEGLPYKLPDVFKPCTKYFTGKSELGSFQGIWEATCGNMVTDKEKMAECVVEGIKKATEGTDILQVSKTAGEKCDVCVKKIGEELGKSQAPAAGRR